MQCINKQPKSHFITQQLTYLIDEINLWSSSEHNIKCFVSMMHQWS